MLYISLENTLKYITIIAPKKNNKKSSFDNVLKKILFL